MEGKSRRQAALLSELKSGNLSNQDEVVEAMRSRGFAVTQPSISRDFRELGIAKKGGVYIVPGELNRPVNYAAHSKGQRGFSEGRNLLPSMVHAVCAAGSSLLVIKTEPGAAQVVAAAIDKREWNEVVGTIAGDDTVFLATGSKNAQRAIMRKLQFVSGGVL